jgi:hypothetical protein
MPVGQTAHVFPKQIDTWLGFADVQRFQVPPGP